MTQPPVKHIMRTGARRNVKGAGQMGDPLSPEQVEKMDVYWRAAYYLSVGQIYLLDNPR